MSVVDGAAGSAAETPASIAVPSPHFRDALRWIFQAEGGGKLVTDSGGPTRWGISKRAHPTVDVESLTQAEAERIYLDSYWRPIRANALPPALALVVFDTAVNLGVTQAIKLLQKALRNVVVDGVIGPETVSAAKMYLPRGELVAQYLAMRTRYYEDLVARDESSLRKFGAYLWGWKMRVFRLALEAGMWRGM